VSIGKAKLTSRIAARFPDMAELGAIERVTVSGRTKHGRPTRIRLNGTSGASKEMGAESFRLAVGSRLMRSTDCRVVTDASKITFLDGHGFGHGIGLCQWGAEGQARIGRRAGDILKFYYPGAHLTRLY
jgi:stage II sporulation protein D